TVPHRVLRRRSHHARRRRPPAHGHPRRARRHRHRRRPLPPGGQGRGARRDRRRFHPFDLSMLRAMLARRAPHLGAAAFGFAVFLVCGGAGILPPGNVAWIPPGTDWGYQWVAWLYFRHAPWGLPLGAIPGLFHPAGLTLANADGIPWLAAAAKLASPILPEPSQYIGPWLALCFVLQGWLGARIAECFTRSRVGIAAGGALFALAPVLLNRLKHPALCAHFLVLYG